MTTQTIPQAPIKFTQARLNALPPADGKRYIVRDSDQPGLICVVHPAGTRHPDGRRTLQVYARAKGIAAPIRVNICEVGELPITALKGQPSVRSRAAEVLAKLREGINPNDELRQQQAEQRQQDVADKIAHITLGDAFDKYIATKALRKQTLDGYRRAIDRDLKGWKGKPLQDITGAMAVTRHAELTKQASANVAARAMAVLRATHHFATEFYGTDDNEQPFGRCPVDKINKIQRKWAQTKPRTGRLSVDELAPWLTAVRNLPAHQKRADGDWHRVAAYLELILLTGLRRREAAYLRWEDVDLRRGTFTVRETKNGADHTLPISNRVRALFKQRQQAAATLADLARAKPTERNIAAAELAETYVIGTAQIQRQLDAIAADTGLKIGPHDLRRTWASMADRAGVGSYGIKAALNHKTTGDVTGLHYAQIDIEDLRPIMQQVEDAILRHAKPRTDNVVALRQEVAHG
ncbi:site-specific integrase [uncultured Thiohalocapsa sp.]|uniref:tyrosine-type recombinase/integrase n=1 Tax=uncultured Thiohalocapsa sp. TaxID=768990 RepID=UPI0025D8C867|nr:site-specific integrase [uncultured Thiohalocapsa sp.]